MYASLLLADLVLIWSFLLSLIALLWIIDGVFIFGSISSNWLWRMICISSATSSWFVLICFLASYINCSPSASCLFRWSNSFSHCFFLRFIFFYRIDLLLLLCNCGILILQFIFQIFSAFDFWSRVSLFAELFVFSLSDISLLCFFSESLHILLYCFSNFFAWKRNDSSFPSKSECWIIKYPDFLIFSKFSWLKHDSLVSGYNLQWVNFILILPIRNIDFFDFVF